MIIHKFYTKQIQFISGLIYRGASWNEFIIPKWQFVELFSHIYIYIYIYIPLKKQKSGHIRIINLLIYINIHNKMEINL